MTQETEQPGLLRLLNGLRTLKGKGWLFVCFLMVYVGIVAQYVLEQKNVLFNQFAHYSELQQTETILIEADLVVFEAYTDLFLMVGNPGRQQVLNNVHQHFVALREKYQQLEMFFPDRAESFKGVVQLLADAVVSPDAARLLTLKDRLASNKQELETLLQANRQMRVEVVRSFQQHSNRVAWEALGLGLLGLLGAGLIISLFFGRMARDIGLLKRRVQQITRGYRGEPLAIRRQDELGALVEGVNKMAGQLRQREQELELERRNRFNREKRGDMQQLIAGLVHELGNPVAAVSGLAQALVEEESEEERQLYLDQINQYASRMVGLVEDLTRIGQPMHSSYHMVDLNQVIQHSAGLLRYDERWQGIDVSYELDATIPPIPGRSEQLEQVVINLLSNAFDALEGIPDPRVEVRTLQSDGESVQFEVEDNGCGITLDRIERVFDTSYSTKGEGEGRGLGLPLCKALIDAHHGSISIESGKGLGTRILIRLPLQRADERPAGVSAE
ncbi:sensor histidine kinase [Aestuariirhabdus litorea]|uniref:histidine kinase n=1 Tax=Aestuariirhabdus litorea TaxID=2528527 RepID=A0A3P3VV08_9GAMM|nr:HAMP domain-containing sensor histidine kinase [Aestuariirhabdus litorea]RRJ85269.1 sensor histidine kinase [Aestuariirhabdus litorea]RWW98491.1 HAMP domain-containing protein [Endozoicomonadaceae bacterium GTF-13]